MFTNCTLQLQVCLKLTVKILLKVLLYNSSLKMFLYLCKQKFNPIHNMYILVNKKVMNVLNLNVSDIHKFDKESLIKMFKYIHTSCSNDDSYHFKLIYNYALSEKWFGKNTSHNEYDEEFQLTNYIYDFEDVREGYFFTVEDNRYIICF